MAGPCFQDSNCIDLSQVGGQLRADINLSEDACNSLVCRPNGLFAPTAVNRITASNLIPAGITVSLAALIVGNPTIVFTSPAILSPNPSPCYTAGLFQFFTPREIQYTGVVGDQFAIRWENTTNGSPYGVVCSITVRCSQTGIIEQWAMPSAVNGLLTLPAGAFTTAYRLVITRILGVGSVITPGATFTLTQTAPSI